MAKLGNYWKGFYLTWWSTYVELLLLAFGLLVLLYLLVSSVRKLYFTDLVFKKHIQPDTQAPKTGPQNEETSLELSRDVSRSSKQNATSGRPYIATPKLSTPPLAPVPGGSGPSSTSLAAGTPPRVPVPPLLVISARASTPQSTSAETSRTSTPRPGALKMTSLAPTISLDAQQQLERSQKLKQASRTKNSIKSIKKIKWYNKLLLCSCLACAVFQVMFSIVLAVSIALFNVRVPCGVRALSVIPTCFQRVLMYVFFSVRIHDTFRKSVIRMKKHWLVVFICLNACLSGSMLFWYIWAAFVYSSGENGFDCNYDQMYPSTVVLISIDACTNLFLGLLFTWKLNQVGQMVVEMQHGAMFSKNGGKKLQANEEMASKYSKLVRKLRTLVGCNVVLSAMSFGLIITWLSYSATCIDMVVSSICLCLCFQFNHKYYKIFCKCFMQKENRGIDLRRKKNAQVTNGTGQKSSEAGKASVCDKRPRESIEIVNS